MTINDNIEIKYIVLRDSSPFKQIVNTTINCTIDKNRSNIGNLRICVFIIMSFQIIIKSFYSLKILF
ncbi:hypothetical protein EMIT036CA2_70233 [Chryseobacterium sp. IT-36CA2]